MTKAQSKAVTLLQEISSVCRNKNLPFYLISESSIQGLRSHGFESEKPDIYIAMLYKDMMELTKTLKKENRSNREIETLYSNPKLRSNYVRYIDKESLYFPLKNPLHISKYGVSVSIIPLFSKEVDSNRSLKKFLYLYWSENLGTKWRTKATSIVARSARKICTIICQNANDARRRWLLDKLCEFENKATVNDTLYMFTIQGRKKILFPKGLFKDTTTIPFEDVECRFPSDSATFMEKQYGFNWEEKRYRAKEVQKFLLIDGELPYQEYFSYLDENGISTDMEMELKGEQAATKELKKHNKVIKNAWNAVRRTDARIHLWQQYSSQKDEIIKLYNEGNWDQLSVVLKDFDLENRRQAKNKMSVSFDQQIWDIYLQLLHQRGEDKLANRLDKWLPDEYRTDFTI